MIELINEIDTQVFLFFNGMHTGFLDNFMMLFTGRFVWVPMYAALLYTLLRNNPLPRAAVLVGCIVLSIVIADQTCSHLIRPAVERLRPSNPANPLSQFAVIVDGYRGGSYGFPSCHAANSFALAMITALLLRDKRAGIFIFAWAAVNSYSRLYLGVHYPGDLLAGAAIGCAAGALCYGLSQILPPAPQHCDKPMGAYFRTSDAMMLTGLAVVAVMAVVSIVQ